MASRKPRYLRHHGRVEGPFPTGQIQQYLVLGRIGLDDEVSEDGEQWRSVRAVPELIPEVLSAAPDDEEAQDRLRAARRWADERRGEPAVYGGQDRRRHRAPERKAAAPGDARPTRQGLVHAVLVLLVAGGLVLLALRYTPSAGRGGRDCGAAPAPRVDWSQCNLEGRALARADLRNATLDSSRMAGARMAGARLAGASLEYAGLSGADLRQADLRQARLKGASLRGANLMGANVSGADFSYADLTGAELGGVRWGSSVRLDHALWADGRECLAGSVGRCRRAGGRP